MNATETAKHTPGPWKVDEYGVFVSVASTDEFVCQIEPDRYHEGEREANARLIAAAPDMLEALEKYEEHFGDPLKLIRAAIQKARGE